MSKLIALAVLGLTLGACTATTQPRSFYAVDHAPVLRPRPVTSVAMFWGDAPARPFRYLGLMVVELDRDFRVDRPAVQVLHQLQADGAEHGCDAVVLYKAPSLYWPGRRVAHAAQYAKCLQYTDAPS